MKPLIKICGVADGDNLIKLIKIEKINFLGFIFYKQSPRNATKEFINSISNLDFKNKRAVCVYVNADREFIEETSSYFANPILQFHGDETNAFCKSFKKDFWKVIRVKDAESIKLITNYPDASGILFENYETGIYGGTGNSFDWNLMNNIKDLDIKIILSGGINIKNVDNAIDINPWCIDINSGVESSPGLKDINLTNKLIEKI
tara:strand:- start:415 stop:1026 length:612 start_codon:yes stop_codon:yes gene_type:complete